MITDELILYRNFKLQDILNDMITLFEGKGDPSLAYAAAGKLITMATERGFYGNLWHDFLTYLLANNENAFSKACEIRGASEGTLNDIAMHDMGVFYQMFFYNIEDIDRRYDVDCFSMLTDFNMPTEGYMFNRRIRDHICTLSENLAMSADPGEMKLLVENFYKDFGVGLFGLHKAFKIHENPNNNDFDIVPIKRVAHVKLEDLVGYELQKEKLIANTEAFLSGLPANNCLLYGDSGTGKSSSIKGIMNKYYGKGLRIIELYKHQFRFLNDIMAILKERNYCFIIYMDDLSFEDQEIEYKYLKAVIEGGLEKKPNNVLIYATSNRRHLIHEGFKDKLDRSETDDIHESDTVEEKLSLYHRFGMTIYYGKPTPKEFKQIVTTLAEKHSVHMDEEDLLLKANRWEIEHGGLSGRTARQFIDHILSRGEQL
ncbi:MAG: ATP-binding protein [Lachnospiraceae bacterium]|nr:ATP-binding protein [Lachnospiraceae bacterium]